MPSCETSSHDIVCAEFSSCLPVRPAAGLVTPGTYRTKFTSIYLMEYITLRLDSTNEVEHWYVRHKYFYCLIT